MINLLVNNLLIGNLDKLFEPSGLPLVEKVQYEHTTSILVWGPPGSGRTTLAVALARAISLVPHGGGFAFYLSTEIVPTELKFKLELLGQTAACLYPWPLVASAKPGDIVSVPLSLFNEERPVDSSLNQKESVSFVIDKLLYQNDKLVPLPTPARVVVIDSLKKPTSDELDSYTSHPRNPTLDLIQGLEHSSISPIIVADKCPGHEWLASLVDIVFDTYGPCMEYSLKCGKSRYSQVWVGVYPLEHRDGKCHMNMDRRM